MNPSTAQARVIVDELVRNTVTHVVLCPGSRNAPLSLALYDAAAADRVSLHVRVDERSAAFLALGIAARAGRPVAVACTSGTAAANFHPAVLEADRAGVPLIVLTADRPPELRAAGANQVIDQHRLYGDAVRYFGEFAVAHEHPGQNAYWRSQVCRAWNAAYGEWRSGPVHLNVPFREPLTPSGDDEWCEPLEGRAQGQRWTELPEYGAVPAALGLTRRRAEKALSAAHLTDGAGRAFVVPSTRTGLVIACDSGTPAVSEWAAEHGWPVIAETGAAGLSGDSAVTSGAWLLGVPGFVAAHRPEQVLCIGRPTVFRQVQALLADTGVEVLLVRPDTDWPAPAHNVRQVGQWFTEPSKPADPQWLARWQQADQAARDAVAQALAAEPWPNGPAVAAELLAAVPAGSLLVVGSSNPTRDIALAAGPARPDVLVHRNRGVAGIDGTVSTAVGAALVHGAAGGPSYALLGDVTFLHDLNGLLTGSLEQRPDLTVVVLNDDGGGIFSLLEQGADAQPERFERVFGTPHGADISALCAGYGVPHAQARTREELHTALQPSSGLRVVEVRADRASRRGLHDRLQAAVAAAVDTLTA